MRVSRDQLVIREREEERTGLVLDKEAECCSWFGRFFRLLWYMSSWL